MAVQTTGSSTACIQVVYTHVHVHVYTHAYMYNVYTCTTHTSTHSLTDSVLWLAADLEVLFATNVLSAYKRNASCMIEPNPYDFDCGRITGVTRCI